MPATVTINTKELSSCFEEMSYLIPAGASEISIGVLLHEGQLSFFYTGGAVYIRNIPVTSGDFVQMTVRFYPLHNVLNAVYVENTTLILGNDGLRVQNDIVDLFLTKGFQEIEIPILPTSGYTMLPVSGWDISLKSVLGIGLDRLYMKELPIEIGNGLSALKYPNTWIRCRTHGLNLNRLLEAVHIKLLIRLCPTGYQLLGTDSVLFNKGNTFVMLPCRALTDTEETDKNFNEMLSHLSKPITLGISHYLDSVRGLSKLSNASICNIRVFEAGIQTSVTSGGNTMSVSCGSTEGLIGTAQIPVNVWLAFLRAMGTETIQILIGGDILCLRNQTLLVLTHARG